MSLFKILLTQLFLLKLRITTTKAAAATNSFLDGTKNLLSTAVTTEKPFTAFIYYSASSVLMKENYAEIFSVVGSNEDYQSVELKNISISTNETCLYEYSQKYRVKPTFSGARKANRFSACRLTIIYILNHMTEFIKLFITGHGHCLPYPPECSVEWNNYWVIVESESLSAQTNYIVDTSITLKLLLLLQNAILLSPALYGECCEIYIMKGYQGKWSKFARSSVHFGFPAPAKEIYYELLHVKHKFLVNYDGNPVGVIEPFYSTNQDAVRYKRTHIRSEMSYAPSELTCATVIKSLNATYKSALEGSGKGSNVLDQFVPKSNNILTMPISLTPERNHAYAFSAVISWSYIHFITSPQKLAGKSLAFLSKPFEIYVWGSLFVAWTLVSITIYVTISRIKVNIDRFRRSEGVHNFASVGSALLFPLLDQSNQYFELERRKNVKNDIDSKFLNALISLLIAVWLLCILVLSSLYKSKILSFLVTPTYVHMPNTFQELVLESDYEIWVPRGFAMGSMKAYFDSMNNSFSKKFLARYIESETMTQCFEVLREKVNRACVAFDIFITSLANKVLISPKGESMFRKPPDAINPIPSGLGISPYSHGLKRASDSTLNRLQQGGILRMWLASMESISYYIGKGDAVQKSVSSNTTNSIFDTTESGIVSSKDIQLPMIILSIGIATAAIILVSTN